MNIFYKTICQFFYFRVSHFIKGTICKIFFFIYIYIWKSLEQLFILLTCVITLSQILFAFYWLFSYTNCPIQHSFMAIHTYMYWSNLIFNLKRTIIFKCFIQNNNTELSSKVATENVELVRPDSVWLQVKTSHWEISIQVNVDRTDGDISESAKLKMTESVCNGALSQCQNTHTHFCCLVTLWVISQLAVLWLRDIFFFLLH